MAIYMGMGRARGPEPEPEPPPDCVRELKQGDSCLSELFSTLLNTCAEHLNTCWIEMLSNAEHMPD